MRAVAPSTPGPQRDRRLTRGRGAPAALRARDENLAVALEALVARIPISATVDIDLRSMPDPAVQAVARLCVGELVTNAARHAEASGVYVLVDEQRDALRIRVRDDGRGGAGRQRPGSHGKGSGLSRLAERVVEVDGTLDVVSPTGGPTVVTVILPLPPPS